jgi:Xaa-Pro aminopeptidase
MEGQRIGYDPWLMTRSQVRQIARRSRGPARNSSRSTTIRSTLSGATGRSRRLPQSRCSRGTGRSADGREDPDIARLISDKRADAAVLTDPASIAWLFNIRGGDVPRTPLALSFAFVHASGRP